MTIQLTQVGSENFIQSGNTEATNSVADLIISNIGNSSSYMTIGTSGNIGIGTTTPNYTLDINGTLDISNSNGVFLFNSAGNICIGTTSPDNTLTIGSNNVNNPLNFILINQSGHGELAVAAGPGQYSNSASAGDVILRSGGGKVFLTSSASNLGICVNGSRTGINTTDPAQQLAVNGGVVSFGNTPITQQGAYLQWNRSGGDGETWLLNQRGGGTSNSGIRFGSTTQNTDLITEWMRIIENGNVGIGTASPSSTLHVANSFRAPGGSLGNSWTPEVGGAFINFSDVSSSYYIMNGALTGIWQGTITGWGGAGTYIFNLPVAVKGEPHYIGYWRLSNADALYRLGRFGPTSVALLRPGSTNGYIRIDENLVVGAVWTLIFNYLV